MTPPSSPPAAGLVPAVPTPVPSRGELRAALREANLPTLLTVLAHLTGDDRWLREPYAPTRAVGLDDHDTGGLDPAVQQEVRAAALDVLLARGLTTPAPALAPARIAELLRASVAEAVPASYGELLAEELGQTPRDADVPPVPAGRDLHVVIIGAGLSGLCQAIKLEQAGIAYTVLEKNHGIGGTWYENTYPGCGVDTPSSLYSFSFAQRPDWSRYFVQRDELHAYWEQLAADSGVAARTRFGCEVTAAEWDAEAACWRLAVDAGEGRTEALTADVLISAVGLLNRPATPRIDGLDAFGGPVVHTAVWDPDVDLAGKRVAVIGTGASAMQLVPAIVDDAARVTVFQRSPQWAVPHPNYHRATTPATRTLMEHVPGYAGWYRLRVFWRFGDRPHALTQIDRGWKHPDRSINAASETLRRYLTHHIETELKDRPDLLAKSLPTYPPYGKRPLVDNGWYRTLRRDDVDLVTDAVTSVSAGAVHTAAGETIEADVIVLATGFQSLKILGPMDIRGRSGTLLRDTWGEDDARAHLGITIPDLPNFFCLYGPNTNTGHGGTIILTSEFQVRYVMELLATMVADDIATVEVRQAAHDAYNTELDAALEDTIWTHPGMTTYYRNSRGRIVTNSPWSYGDYWRRTRRPDLADFHVEHRAAATTADDRTTASARS
ncbi:4-hydroxyacetophenone monooxygenase [Paraconexibacter sp. AEG42_29]|uniref:4-hydroxyacetophenone monooxygenase n=1 Tax=Paraconexibacter sp. AEG42_29 TaxID=2997339 RepID=A0AAU7AYR7_9ACTN